MSLKSSFLALCLSVPLFAGCAGTETTRTENSGGMSLSEVKGQMKQVPELLVKFGSKDPNEWRKAYLELKSMDEKLVHRDLVRMAEQAQDPASPTAKQARERLARLGKIELELTKFNTSDFNLWEDTRKKLMEMGADATDSLILKLVSVFKRRAAEQWDMAKIMLIRIGQPAVPYLVGFVASPSAPQPLRDKCAETLVHMGKLTEDEVRKGAASPTQHVRMAFAQGLGAKRTALTFELLRNLVADNDWQVRGTAVQSLSKLRTPEAVPLLITALKDPEPVVQYEAAQGLELLKDKRAIGPLIELLKRAPRSDTVGLIKVDSAAAAALRATTGQKFGTNAEDWERWCRQNK